MNDHRDHLEYIEGYSREISDEDRAAIRWALSEIDRLAAIVERLQVTNDVDDRDADELSPQCDFVHPHGVEGYLCCVRILGHDGPHSTAYVDPQPTNWMRIEDWQRDYGEAARNAYIDLSAEKVDHETLRMIEEWQAQQADSKAKGGSSDE